MSFTNMKEGSIETLIVKWKWTLGILLQDRAFDT